MIAVLRRVFVYEGELSGIGGVVWLFAVHVVLAVLFGSIVTEFRSVLLVEGVVCSVAPPVGVPDGWYVVSHECLTFMFGSVFTAVFLIVGYLFVWGRVLSSGPDWLVRWLWRSNG